MDPSQDRFCCYVRAFSFSDALSLQDHRWIEDKRTAYSAFLAACEDVADIRENHRGLDKQRDALQLDPEATAEEWDRLYQKRSRADDRYEQVHRDINATLAVVDLLAPSSVCELAVLYSVVSHRPHLHPRRLAAQVAFVTAARADLGIRGGWGYPQYEYEPWDDGEAEAAIAAEQPQEGGST